MLNILVGRLDYPDRLNRYVFGIDEFFDNFHEKSWLDYWAMHVVKTIDNSELTCDGKLMSPWLGDTIVERISGGAKQLIMMKKVPTVVYNGDNFGDNCWSLLLLLSKYYDICMTLTYFPRFEWCDGATIRFINNGKVVTSYDDYVEQRSNMISITDRCYNFDEILWPIKIDASLLNFEIDF